MCSLPVSVSTSCEHSKCNFETLKCLLMPESSGPAAKTHVFKTWLIWEITHSIETWRIHMRHDALIRDTKLWIDSRVYQYYCRDFLIPDMTHLRHDSFIRDMTHSDETWRMYLRHWNVYQCQSLAGLPQRIMYSRHDSVETWLIH